MRFTPIADTAANVCFLPIADLAAVAPASLGRSFAGLVPRYFFHLYDDIVSTDPEGKELPSLQAARENAIEQAREMACAEVQNGHLSLKHRIEIANDSGKVLAVVQFKDVVDVEGS